MKILEFFEILRNFNEFITLIVNGNFETGKGEERTAYQIISIEIGLQLI